MSARDLRETARRPWVERVWEGAGSPLATWTLRALAPLYAAGAGVARASARRSRRRVAGVRVVAIGGLAVGGAGKTTIARWAAREALALGIRPAIVLRGHGSVAATRPAELVTREAALAPDGARRFGDEAVAHRESLPAEGLVIVGADRAACAAIARERGAALVILDDGWEQRRLAWDALWVALDPLRPFANGRTLPAGPLRRAPAGLAEADAILLIAEAPGETTSADLALVSSVAPARPVVRFLRVAASWSALGDAAGSAAPAGSPAPPVAQRPSALAAPAEGPAPQGPALLVSSVGAPERLQRFVAGAGVSIAEHLAFPDHAAWDRPLVARRAAALRAEGVATLVVTDKDARRAALLGDVGLPILVVRSRLSPLDAAAPLLAWLGASGEPGGPRSSAAGPAGPGMAGFAPIR